VKSILQKYPNVDSAELRAARTLVDSTWRGTPPGANIDLFLRIIGAVLFIFFPWFIASCAITIGLLARRGLLMRGFALDVVNKKGEPAGRVRIFLRNVVTWSPVLAPFVIYAVIMAATPATAALAAEGAGIAVLIVLAIGVGMAIRTPERGLADRLVGTYLVPE